MPKKDYGMIFCDGDKGDTKNWFFSKYYASNVNSRFWTFSCALNLLNQREVAPVIIETGCQREKDDLGAGMSTSIFAEYISRHGGVLHVVDNVSRHLHIAKQCVKEWEKTATINYHHADSVEWLKKYNGLCDLVYLDSYDYPILEMSKKYHPDLETAMKIMSRKNHSEIFQEFEAIARPCQEHCVNEFKAIEDRLDEQSIVLIDDNRFPGGGKPGLVKQYLADKGWTCLLDFQQTLWIRSL